MKKIIKKIGLSAGVAFAFTLLSANISLAQQTGAPNYDFVSAVSSSKHVIKMKTSRPVEIEAKADNAPRLQQQWFVLRDNVAATRANALIASNYEPFGDAQPCGTGSTFCGVLADDMGGTPDMGTVSSDIENFFDGLGQAANISAQP